MEEAFGYLIKKLIERNKSTPSPAKKNTFKLDDPNKKSKYNDKKENKKCCE